MANLCYKGTYFSLYKGEVDDELLDLYLKYEDMFGESADCLEDAGFEGMKMNDFKVILRYCLKNNIDVDTALEPITSAVAKHRGWIE